MKKLISLTSIMLILTSCIYEHNITPNFLFNTNNITVINESDSAVITVTSNNNLICRVNAPCDFTLSSDQNILIEKVPVDKNVSVTSVLYYPSQNTNATFMVEDLYPNMGDYDFNDLGLYFNMKYTIDKTNKVTSILLKYKFIADGYKATPSGFGIKFSKLNNKYLTNLEQVIFQNCGKLIKGKEYSYTFNFITPVPLNLVTIDNLYMYSIIQNKYIVSTPYYMIQNGIYLFTNKI